MSKKKISKLLSNYKSDDEIYYDLMQFKVREILLVATIYDAFILEQEGKLTELIYGEYHQLNLSLAPRVTSVTYGDEALELLGKKHFDMVILTMRIDEWTPFELSKKIKVVDPSIPILLLLNDDSDIEVLKGKGGKLRHFDKIFIWNGDAKVLLAMIKYIEDKINVVEDTRIGRVQVILLIEDSIRYYSRYLPLLHVEIMKQTQRLIVDEQHDDMKKLLRMRARPKVLMAGTYEEALALFEKYRDYLLCVISDVAFPREDKMDDQAGLKLIRYLKEEIDYLPVLLQSSDRSNEVKAAELGAAFLDKNSDSLPQDLTDYITGYLGFGDFVFRNSNGDEIAVARSNSEFRKLLKTVPDESLFFHSMRNHFSSWLMARGEIQTARNMRPVKVSDFKTSKELRAHLIGVCENVEAQRTKGKILLFSESAIRDDNNVIRLSGGSLGGKGRGMAVLNMLMQSPGLFPESDEIEIKIPETLLIGTDEYDYFMDANMLRELFKNETDYEKVKQKAIESDLSPELRENLAAYLLHVHCPLAVRSSSLFEDSKSQPFAGIYETFLIPNSHSDLEVRTRHLEEAIKLVFASVFSDSTRAYFESINYRVGEEKMAVLIQRVAGSQHGDRFYPTFSGVAQSYNYYPVSYIKPTDGISVIAFGLGKHVVDGGKAWRFCPKYPGIDFVSREDIFRDSQVTFFALDMDEEKIDLLKGSDENLFNLEIEDASNDGALDYCVSVWDNDSQSLQVGPGYRGPKIVNFANILKYDYIPLAPTIDTVLEIINNSMGMPVNIEFAVELGGDEGRKSIMYLLQIRPLLGDFEEYDIDLEGLERSDLLLYTDKALGNGTISGLRDIIFLDPEKFDKTKTVEMTTELDRLNREMRDSGGNYILIGPGRWGTRDPLLGVPVKWSNLCNAGIIVEVELEDFHIEASLGSHFFHNITSKNIGYFHVPYRSDSSFIDWEWLRSLPVYDRTEHFTHIRLDEAMGARMDGRKGISLIFKREK